MQARHERTEHSSAREICVCVDDFGLHQGINDAVLALVGMGRVQAASVQVGGPAWSAGARELRQLDPQGVDVGLHLDLTECPLQAQVRMSLKEVIASAYANRLHAPLLRTEIRAQLEAFEQAMGRAPAYVDGHQHVHQLPQVRALLVEELLRRYPDRSPGRMPWLRSTRSPQPKAHADLATGAKAWVIAALGSRGLAALAGRHGMRQNARLLGVYDFGGDASAYRQRLSLWLQAAASGDLLMCHAGLSADRADPLAKARGNEFSVLSSLEFAERVAFENIRLRPMSQILEPQAAAPV